MFLYASLFKAYQLPITNKFDKVRLKIPYFTHLLL